MYSCGKNEDTIDGGTPPTVDCWCLYFGLLERYVHFAVGHGGHAKRRTRKTSQDNRQWGEPATAYGVKSEYCPSQQKDQNKPRCC